MGSRIVVNSLNSFGHDHAILLRESNCVKSRTLHPDTTDFLTKYKNRLGKLGKIIFKQPDIDKVNMANFISQFISQFIPTVIDIKTSQSSTSIHGREVIVHIFVQKHDEALKLYMETLGLDKVKESLVYKVCLTTLWVKKCKNNYFR
jgi:hypothetical protein